MPKRNKHDRATDANALAHHLVEASTYETADDIHPPTKDQVSLLMATLGRKGGKIGGKRRLQTMTAKQRTAVARRAAKARWHKNKK
jgi:hypothetical protein